MADCRFAIPGAALRRLLPRLVHAAAVAGALAAAPLALAAPAAGAAPWDEP